jgi:antitoxin CptB
MPGPLMSTPLDAAGLSRLKWRCRRGMLENDLLLERFFKRHEGALTLAQAQAIESLMDLPDNDLLDLLLARTEPQGELDQPDVQDVLGLIRVKRTQSGESPRARELPSV